MVRNSWDASCVLKCPVHDNPEDEVAAGAVGHVEVVAMAAVVAATVEIEVAVTEEDLIVEAVATVEDVAEAAAADTEMVVEVAAVTVVDEEVMMAVRIRGNGIKRFPNFLRWS